MEVSQAIRSRIAAGDGEAKLRERAEAEGLLRPRPSRRPLKPARHRSAGE